jgi:hypothetical protein
MTSVEVILPLGLFDLQDFQKYGIEKMQELKT